MPEIKLIYQQIKEYIENEAKNKTPGDFLKSEVQYSLHFNVSRPTVRKAVDELMNDGLIRRIPGKGLIVSDPDVKHQNGTLLFLIPYVPDDGFFYNMVMGCVDSANDSDFGYKIFNNSSPAERLSEVKSILPGEYKAAVLTAYDSNEDYKLLEYMSSINFPFILIDNPSKQFDVPYVITDDYKGGYISAEYLLKKGHTNILYVTRKADLYTTSTRKKGFLKALLDHGIEYPDKNIIYLDRDEDIVQILPEININYTVICGYCDLPVILAYDVLHEMGLNIPEQVSLMGYGDFRYSGMLKCPLTTISMPVYDMGYRAVKKAVEPVGKSIIPDKSILDVTLLERESVVPPYHT
jgi:GntR family transcriptional regulator, arabinose operon transcriptional repressor